MKSVKDGIDPKQLKGVYKISCSCGKCYIGEIGHSFKVRLKEHNEFIRNRHFQTLALTEKSLKKKHEIHLEGRSVLAKQDHYYRRHIRESIEIIKHPNNINRDGELKISRCWIPLIQNNRNHHHEANVEY